MVPRADQPDVLLVQTGWHIFSRDGEPLGKVLQVDGYFMDVGHSGSRIKVPTDLITEQEEGEKRARLSVDADAIEEVSIRVLQI
jgi:hypothetical protein